MAGLLFFVLSGCSSSPTKKYDKQYRATEEVSFEQWQNFPKLNLQILESDSHNAYIDIHANASGKKAYESRAKLFPVGAIIYKPIFHDEKGEDIIRLTVMVKRERGYDNENGDWWYGVYDKTGTEAWYQGRIHSCIKCHKIAEETDYLFTEKVMDNIEMQAL